MKRLGKNLPSLENDTHQLPFAKMMGFAKSLTHPTRWRR